jgi:DNA replication protein DnaC
MATRETRTPALRRLKRSGMLDAIPARAAARAPARDPLDFLLLLLEDELARREAEGVARRIRWARFEDICARRDFDFGDNPEIPKGQLWELASGRYLAEWASILLCGPTGVGKTVVAPALGLEACRQGRRVLFAKTTAVLADLAGGRADGSGQGRLGKYLGAELLLLDDFGMGEYPLAQAEDLYELGGRR